MAAGKQVGHPVSWWGRREGVHDGGKGSQGNGVVRGKPVLRE